MYYRRIIDFKDGDFIFKKLNIEKIALILIIVLVVALLITSIAKAHSEENTTDTYEETEVETEETAEPAADTTWKIVLKSVKTEDTETTVSDIETTSEDTTVQTYKPSEEIADEVIKGLWGNGIERQERIIAAGYDYDEIQKIVDEKCPKISSTSKSVNTKTNDKVVVKTQSGSNYLGNFKITGYYAGEGGVGQVSASGMKMSAFQTCAMNNTRRKELGIKYGDYITVSGIGSLRVVDCGCSYNTIDVYVNSKKEAYSITSYRDVYK